MTDTINKHKYKWVTMPALFLAGLALGYFFFGSEKPKQKDKHDHAASATKEEIWTCSMHPNIRKNEPGQCPICFMDLIKLKEDSGSTDIRTLKLSAAARQLAEIQTAAVFSGPATKTLRLPGTVQLDETRIKHVTAWVGGRIEKLYVNYTGIPVNNGDHMAEFYSPDLLAAQEELRRSMGNESLHRNVVERLLRWGIDRKQIENFKNSANVSELVTINSPAAGIVVEKAVKEGMYVKQGTRLFSIADMNQLWLMAKIYERDIQWLRYGQQVECEFFLKKAAPSMPA
jgi:Cu(I)/Ag(I) efflux system membrane fusion protein